MPKQIETTDEELQDLIETGGNKPETIARRNKIMKEFRQFVETENLNFDEVVEARDGEVCENLMVKYLNGCRVTDKDTGKLVRPKGPYFAFLKSNVQCGLKELTGLNFSDAALFPKFNKGSKAIQKDIKATGRAEVTHHEEIPPSTMDSIFELCGWLQNLMEARLNADEFQYQVALEYLPFEWRNNYNELLRICVQFLVTLMDARRGNEGIAALTKDHFRLRESNGLKFFEKVSRIEKYLQQFEITKL